MVIFVACYCRALREKMKKRRAAMEVIDVRLNVTFLVVLYAGIYEEVFIFSDNSAKTFFSLSTFSTMCMVICCYMIHQILIFCSCTMDPSASYDLMFTI